MITPTPISLLMVGCGAFAHRYHVPALEADAALEIVGIFDPSPSAQTRSLASRRAAVLVNRLEDLPNPEGVVCAIVTTPHALHATHITPLLERGWHTLVDKPFVMAVKDARQLATQAQARGLVNGVAYNRRFDPGCLRARDIVRSGGIGEVRFVQTVQLGYERSGWFLVPALGGGGPYTGRLTHMTDIVPWLLGQRPTKLRSRLRTSDPKRTDHGGMTDILLGDLEWQATCIEEGWHMWDEIRMFGEDGLIELRRPLHLPIGWEMSWTSQRGSVRETLTADSQPGGATRDFLAAVRTGTAPAVTFAEAVSSVALVELAFESARNGGQWIDVPDLC